MGFERPAEVTAKISRAFENSRTTAVRVIWKSGFHGFLPEFEAYYLCSSSVPELQEC